MVSVFVPILFFLRLSIRVPGYRNSVHVRTTNTRGSSLRSAYTYLSTREVDIAFVEMSIFVFPPERLYSVLNVCSEGYVGPLFVQRLARHLESRGGLGTFTVAGP